MFTLTSSTAMAEDEEGPEGETAQQKEDRLANVQGKFNAGARVRFPNGPDEMGEFKTFNWVAVDLQGRYNLTNLISTYLTVPLAVKHPDGAKTFGGVTGRIELLLGASVGAGVTVGMLRERAFLLSDKDYPAYVGDLKFGTALGPIVRLKTSVVNLRLEPSFVYQATDPTTTGFQLPVVAMIRLGDMLKVSGDIGLYSGDDFKVAASDGGRLGVGAAVDIKVGSIGLHLGTGLASLLTSDEMGALYPSVGKSLYFDVSLKYMK